MKWSWKVAEVAGIGIYIHWTFLILVAWVLVVEASQGGSMATALWGVALVLAVFACVVLHELGHALTAKRYGILTRDITLLPIGGVARLERIPEEPRQELWVALAGPAVNGVIAVGLIAVIYAMEGLAPFSRFALVGGHFLVNLAFANVILGAFNLLPAFPMDGGRVLRALLAERMDYVRATQIAANVGQAMAVVFGVLGFFLNWLLLFVALFVYLGAQQEAQAVEARSLLRGVPVRDAMITRFRPLSENARLADVLPELLAGDQQDFPVVQDERILGMLTRNALLTALAEGGQDVRVAQVMHRDCGAVDESDMLEKTFEQMRQSKCPAMPVLRSGRVVGMITLENVGEWMMIQSALRQARARHRVDNIFRTD